MRTTPTIVVLSLTAALSFASAANALAQVTTAPPPPTRPVQTGQPMADQPTATSTANLGTVRITQAVTANGEPLAAGSYQVRLTTESPAKVVGQTVAETRWVEFMRGTTVAGREVATLVSSDDMRTMAKMPRKGGAVRTETLKGGDYLRVWITHAGQHVLIHLPITR
jgi:hypothetical protein